VPDSQAIFYFWATLRAEGWGATVRVLVSACGDTWVVKAAKGGKAVEGRAASPEAAWGAAYWKALGVTPLRTRRAPLPSAEAPECHGPASRSTAPRNDGPECPALT
jgi:hypothetical protein